MAATSTAAVPPAPVSPPQAAPAAASDDAPPAWLSDAASSAPTADQINSAQSGATTIAGGVDQRAWDQVKSGDTDGAAQTVAYNVARNQASAQANQMKAELGSLPGAWKVMKFMNVANAILCCGAVVERLNGKSLTGNNTDTYVIAMYVFAFATLLFCYETVGLFDFVAYLLADNFGFLYTVTGRLGFMLMTNVIIISLGTIFAYCVAGIGITNAFYNAGVMMYYPDWTRKMMEDQTAAANGKR